MLFLVTCYLAQQGQQCDGEPSSHQEPDESNQSQGKHHTNCMYDDEDVGGTSKLKDVRDEDHGAKDDKELIGDAKASEVGASASNRIPDLACFPHLGPNYRRVEAPLEGCLLPAGYGAMSLHRSAA